MLGTKDIGQFLIFELHIYGISYILNFKRFAHEGQLPPPSWIDAANHLIFNVHHLFDLNLMKKNSSLWRKSVTGS